MSTHKSLWHNHSYQRIKDETLFAFIYIQLQLFTLFYLSYTIIYSQFYTKLFIQSTKKKKNNFYKKLKKKILKKKYKNF